MPRRTLNLGILAHVDAGKTTLTERLLYAAGVIDEIGSVDAGTTQTDSLALERQRGITIKSAVVSFAIGGVTVNLIDTPGHPDFIAEVERVLSVLDGAVLVISAVEGVQPQTRVLMRALQRLRIPALLFVNKIDRPGAGEERVLRAISARLSPAIVAMGGTSGLGTRAAGFTPWDEDDAAARARLAEVLADRDERMLAAYVDDELAVPYGPLHRELAAPAARRSPTSGCSLVRCGPATGCVSVPTGQVPTGQVPTRQVPTARARSPRSACSSEARRRHASRSRPARSGNCVAWTRSRSVTRSGRPGTAGSCPSSPRRRWNRSWWPAVPPTGPRSASPWASSPSRTR